MEGRDYNDSDILSATTQETSKGKVRYRTTLPSDRVVVSEWMNPDNMQGKIVIKWCEFVREQINVDAAEKEAQRKRNRDPIEEEVKQDQVEEATDPVEFAKHQRDLYQDRVKVLETRISDMKVERKRCREHLEQWETIVNNLRGEVDG